MKNISLLGNFGTITVQIENKETKYLENNKAVTQVGKKDIIVGAGGNWRVKWKDVTALSIMDNGFKVESETKTIEALGASQNWNECKRLLEKTWKKLQEKKEKAQREQDLEEKQQKKKFRTYKTTYSKRFSRLAQKVNRMYNSDDDDGDDDGDDIFNRSSRKRQRFDEEVEESKDDQTVGSDEGPAKDDSMLVDEDDFSNNEDVDDDMMVDENDNSEEVEEVLANNEIKAISEETTPRAKSKRKKRFQKRSSVDYESEDGALFDDNVMTTPMRAERIVSPQAKSQTRRALDEDDEKDESLSDAEQDDTDEQMEDTDAGLQDITNFFGPKTKRSPKELKKSTTAKEDVESNESQTKKETDTSKKSTKAAVVSSFFAPRPSNVKDSSRKLSPSSDSASDNRSKDASPHSTSATSVNDSGATVERSENTQEDIDSDGSSEAKSRPIAKKRLFPRAMKSSPSKTESPTKTLKFEKKANHKSSTTDSAVADLKWRGIRNLGNTCYANASLQMLFSVPKFLSAISNLTDGARLTSSVCALWEDLANRNKRGAASARNVKSEVDAATDRFRGYQQRDAHEFLGHVLDEIHEELDKQACKKSAADSTEGDDTTKSTSTLPTDDFFRLNVEVCLKCKSCGYSRKKEEMYRYLSVDVPGVSAADAQQQVTVEKCLASFFEPEDRELKCEKCEDGKEATQTMKVLSRPKALLLHLKRFVFTERPVSSPEPKDGKSPPRAMESGFQKNDVPVELTDKLSLEEFTNNTKGASSGNYALKSIVHHIGSSADSGHYTSDSYRIKDDGADSDGVWVSFDDGITNETTPSSIKNDSKCKKSAYMLLYEMS